MKFSWSLIMTSKVLSKGKKSPFWCRRSDAGYGWFDWEDKQLSFAEVELEMGDLHPSRYIRENLKFMSRLWSHELGRTDRVGHYLHSSDMRINVSA